MRYYRIEVSNGTSITSRIIHTDKSYIDIQKHVQKDGAFKRNHTPHLIGWVEVTKEEYDDFINLFIEEDREKVIKGTTI